MDLPILYKKIFTDLEDAGIKSAEIDVLVLFEYVIKKSREYILAHPEYELSNKEILKLKKLIARRKKFEPLAYLVGKKEFFGVSFFVDKNVLIPRPETEILVEETLKILEARIMNYELWKGKKTLKILDIGTGSGCIIISLAKAYSKKFSILNSKFSIHFSASDISEKALKIAKKNAKKHNANVKFIKSDLFKNIKGKFDLIIANLPYVPINGSDDREIKYEPQKAIFAADNGSAIIKRFLNQAKDHLYTRGLTLLEVDPRNAHELNKYASKLYKSVEIKKDFSGKYRILRILT